MPSSPELFPDLFITRQPSGTFRNRFVIEGTFDLENLRDFIEETYTPIRKRKRIPNCQLCHTPSTTLIKAGNYIRVCINCSRSHTFCGECGQAYRGADCRECTSKYVPGHRYVPEFRPRRTEGEKATPTELLFGVEIEVETPKKVPLAKEVDSKFTWAYVKHDGSVGYGMEINSQPFTWKWLKENEPDINKLFKLIDNQGGSATSRCGLHVHMARRAFSKIQLYKCIRLIYDNREAIIQLSGRTNYEWIEQYAGFDREGLTPVEKARYAGSGGRYSALNTSSHDTVELRIFAGTTNPSRFYAYLQFAHALYYYTSQTGITDVTWKNFTEWVAGRSETYKDLLDIL